MSDGGKGHGRRPLSVPLEVFDDRWEQIFKPKAKKKFSNDYQDILSTEECVENALDDMIRINEELGLYKDYK